MRRLFDPDRYRIVQFDQRGCGLSTPSVTEPDVDLSVNTTDRLLDDIERLREHLGIERWLVQGASWGSTLALAYAEAHPTHVSELIVWGVTTGRWSEFDWIFDGGASVFFPAEWERLLETLPPEERGPGVPAAFLRRLLDPDPAVHEAAAHRLVPLGVGDTGLATIDRHRPDVRRSDLPADVSPGSSPTTPATTASSRTGRWCGARRRWPASRAPSSTVDSTSLRPSTTHGPCIEPGRPAEFTVIDDAGHHSTDAMRRALVATTDRFAVRS